MIHLCSDGTPSAVEMETDNNNTTTACKQIDINVEPYGLAPSIEMETERATSEDSGIVPKIVGDDLDGTRPADETETDNAGINEASASTANDNPRNAETPKNATAAGAASFQSPKIACMNALLEAMSPENKALIAMPTEALIPKVCKQLNPAFRKGKQKVRDHRFRTLEAAYFGHHPLDHIEADIDMVELPPLKRNLVTLVFLYVLDDYGYVLDADFKVFDDDASNSAWEIESNTALEVCTDYGANVTPSRIFPGPPRTDRDFNKTIWGSPGLLSTVIPPERIKSRLPKPTTPKRKAANNRNVYQTPSSDLSESREEYQTISAAPKVLALLSDNRDENQTPSATPIILTPVPDNRDGYQATSAALNVLAPVLDDRDEYHTPSAAPTVLARVPDNPDEYQTPSAALTVPVPVPDIRDEHQTPSAAPTVLATVPRKTMIPMSPATLQIRAVKEGKVARSKHQLLVH